ncbi:MAG: hypothetical protein JNL88_07290, partial [Bacteroidia bacterium]|nr:hypothetical protein [Bacteroidia bacterium]
MHFLSLFPEIPLTVTRRSWCWIGLTWALLLFPYRGFSQESKQIEIVQAGSLEGVKVDGVEVRRLIGNVIFRQDDTDMYCDSALFYESTNSIDA